MSDLRVLLVAAALGTGLLMSGGATASAGTLTKTGGKLHVQARVLPAHTIVVDEQGLIVKIASNTNDDVDAPRVYRSAIDAANEQALTTEIYEEYRRLVPPGQSRIGILYDRNSIFSLLQTPAFSLLPSSQPKLLSLR